MSRGSRGLRRAAAVVWAMAAALAERWPAREFSAAGHTLTLHDGSVGDGVGLGTWLGALELCAVLSGELRHALEVALGRDGALLELGAGTGLVGLFAARHLGAPNVVLTDYVGDDTAGGGVMEMLTANAELTRGMMGPRTGEPSAAAEDGGDEGGGRAADVDVCIEVATLDWRRHEGVDLDTLKVMLEFSGDDDAAAALENEMAQGSSDSRDSSCDGSAREGSVLEWRALAPSRRFEVVLAAECIYEWPGAVCLPAVIAGRLAPGGAAVVLNAVRQIAMFETFLAGLRSEGLRVAAAARNSTQFAKSGVAGAHAATARSSGSGFLLVLCDRADAPFAGWQDDQRGPVPDAGLLWITDETDLTALIEGTQAR